MEVWECGRRGVAEWKKLTHFRSPALLYPRTPTPPSSRQEPRALLHRRRPAGVLLSEDAVTIPGDEVVAPVSQRSRHEPQESAAHGPQPAKRDQDPHYRRRLAERATGRQQHQRVQLLDVFRR